MGDYTYLVGLAIWCGLLFTVGMVVTRKKHPADPGHRQLALGTDQRTHAH